MGPNLGGTRSRTSLQVADDGDEQRENAQDGFREAEKKPVLPPPPVPRAQVVLRAEGKSRVAKKIREFRYAPVLTISQKTPEEFCIGPVAHKKNRARQQCSDSCSESKRERQTAGTKRRQPHGTRSHHDTQRTNQQKTAAEKHRQASKSYQQGVPVGNTAAPKTAAPRSALLFGFPIKLVSD